MKFKQERKSWDINSHNTDASSMRTELLLQTTMARVLPRAQPYRGISICCCLKQAVSKCPQDFKGIQMRVNTTSLNNISLANLAKHSWFWILLELKILLFQCHSRPSETAQDKSSFNWDSTYTFIRPSKYWNSFPR